MTRATQSCISYNNSVRRRQFGVKSRHGEINQEVFSFEAVTMNRVWSIFGEPVVWKAFRLHLFARGYHAELSCRSKSAVGLRWERSWKSTAAPNCSTCTVHRYLLQRCVHCRPSRCDDIESNGKMQQAQVLGQSKRGCKNNHCKRCRMMLFFGLQLPGRGSRCGRRATSRNKRDAQKHNGHCSRKFVSNSEHTQMILSFPNWSRFRCDTV